jgi:rfaE bifunctional protein kinase chain/domain/rfaE bifunctional protein nucleotidyltransferase chain/domain
MKIISTKIIKDLKKKKKKIVMCHGVFDVIHSGHIDYLLSAKQLGGVGAILIVSVTNDKYVNKGPERPIFKLHNRLKVLNSLSFVDYLHVSNELTAQTSIKFIKPNIYCKGLDYKNKSTSDIKLKKEIATLKKNNGSFKVVVTPLESSSKIINKLNLNFDSEQNNYLKSLRKKYNQDSIVNTLEKIRNVKILVIGEIIIDNYIYTEAVGKSGKDNMMVNKIIKKENFIGGSGYIANLIAALSANVTLCSFLSEDKTEQQFTKLNLNKNIKFISNIKKNTPSFKKTRYVDFYKKNKILGIYNITEEHISPKEEQWFIKNIEKKIKNSEIVVIADYGHGIFTKKVRIILNKYKKKIFLNSQINSHNRGYHSLFNFKSANTVVVNESELRYEFRDNQSSILHLILKLKKKIDCKNVIITKGKNGAIFYNKHKRLKTPAFSQNPVDNMGAGDTFLSLISLLLGTNADPELSMLVATVGASYSTLNIGHSNILNKDDLINHISYLIK